MVTGWGMREEVGVVFADYRTDAVGAGLNMHRVELDDLLAGPSSLIMDVNGGLLLNGDDLPARQHSLLAMAAPDANRTTSVSMASLIDSEVQRILQQGYEMARNLLREHYDQLTRLADALMIQEQLDRIQFEALLA